MKSSKEIIVKSEDMELAKDVENEENLSRLQFPQQITNIWSVRSVEKNGINGSRW